MDNNQNVDLNTFGPARVFVLPVFLFLLLSARGFCGFLSWIKQPRITVVFAEGTKELARLVKGVILLSHAGFDRSADHEIPSGLVFVVMNAVSIA